MNQSTPPIKFKLAELVRNLYLSILVMIWQGRYSCLEAHWPETVDRADTATSFIAEWDSRLFWQGQRLRAECVCYARAHVFRVCTINSSENCKNCACAVLVRTRWQNICTCVKTSAHCKRYYENLPTVLQDSEDGGDKKDNSMIDIWYIWLSSLGSVLLQRTLRLAIRVINAFWASRTEETAYAGIWLPHRNQASLNAPSAGQAAQWQVKIILQVESSNQEFHAQPFCPRSGLPKSE